MSRKRKISQQELDYMLQQHALWRYTNGDEGERAEFEEMNLNGLDLCYQSLEGIDFINVSFNKAKLYEVSLIDSSFSDCTFHDADFTNACMQKVALNKVKANRTKFDNADIVDVIINDCEFKECSFRDVSIDYSCICDTGIINCKMNEAIFYRVAFNIMSFKGSNMKDAFVLKCSI